MEDARTIQELKDKISKEKYDLIICDSVDGKNVSFSSTVIKRPDTGAHIGINQSTPIIMLEEVPRDIQPTEIRTINIDKKEYVVAYDKKNDIIYSPVGNTNLDSVSRMISEEKQQIQEGNLIAKAKYNSIQAALESFGEEIEPIINL